MITRSGDTDAFNAALTLAFKVVITRSDLDPVYQTGGRAESAYPNPWSAADYNAFVGIGGSSLAWRLTENALQRAGITNLAAVRVGTLYGAIDPFESARAVWGLCPREERGAALQVWVLDHLRDGASRWFWQLFTCESAPSLYAYGLWPPWMPPPAAMPSGAAVPRHPGREAVQS